MVGFDGVTNPRQLVHQLLVDVQAAGGVEDDDVGTLISRALDPCRHRLDRVRAGEDGHLDLAAQLLELLDSSRALEVGGDERRLVVLLAQEHGELGGRSRLPRALEAGEQDHGRRLPGERELRAARAHQLRQLLVDDLHDLLAGRQAAHHVLAERPLPHACDEVLDDLEVDVGLEQREADLAHRARDHLFVQLPAPAQRAESGVQLVAKGVEHGRTV